MSNEKVIRKQGLAIGYVRVSTKDQEETGISIEAQREMCAEAIKSSPYQFLKIIYDRGLSAGTLNRRGVKEVIQLIESKKIAAIYTVHTDRIARNLEDHIFLRKLCNKNDIELIGITQPKYENNASGKASDNVLATFSEYFKDLTSEKVKDTLYAKANAGFFPGHAPAGYKNIDNPDPLTKDMAKRVMMIDPIMAPIVKELFVLYSTGNYNVYTLNDLMYQKGFTNKKGKKYPPQRVYDLLRNRVFVGEVKWGEGYCKKGKHELFIPESLFNRVQAVLSSHNGNRCKRRKYEWLLAGYLRCPLHNCKYTAEWHLQKKLAYYHCTNRTGCGKYYEQVEMENDIADKFKDLEFSQDFINTIVEKVKARFLKARADYDNNRQSLVNQRTAWEAKRTVNEDKLLKEVLTDEEFTRNKNTINEELNRINTQFSELEDERCENVDIAQEVLLFTHDIYKAYKKGSFLLKRHYLSFFWDRFEVQDGVIKKSVPSPLFQELLALQQVGHKKAKTEKTRNNKGIPSEVIRNATLGAYWESNPDCEFHKLEC